ncbi:cytochrome b-c1 complex subunit 10-like [Onthophagus taurus]|uniref:cytochrome b-c1 complex subunit 10-like n=1 Tax=Onthophagus taurus TaxID=166361 RepID=UPI000C20972D|nr:cytochrome b-c1 complex subunit 10-like [Onthophagus taurus]
MSVLNKFGKKHLDILSLWVSSGVTFGAAAGIGMCYFTEWKTVLQFLPYYNGKYVKDE